MNISYNWLKQYIDTDMPAAELADVLTSVGLETGGVEEVESIRGGLRGIVIGRVLTCVEHPNSDHLHITTVDLGGDEPVQIVCGAPNVAAGQTVVVATVGTTLYGDNDTSFQIKKSKIRGVESLGMICAEDEIGVGTSHDGIIVIDPEKAPAPGTPAATYFGLTSDYVLEVDLTPNRIDAASHYGVARDLSAWLSVHRTSPGLHLPDVSAFRPDRTDGAVALTVADHKACPRYCGLTIRGVRVGESPEWLRNFLSAVGLRPINNIVDITNYILLGIGQPMHCFDVAHIEGDHVTVKTVDEGHPFVTLDEVERKLSSADLMICNDREPMCIAGVFGGLDSGVTEATTDVFLESACFNPTMVRRTARRHGLSTDASFRYERGVDPNLSLYAIKLAALMIKEMAGGEICGDVIDLYPEPVAPYEVTFDYARFDALVGKHIDRAEVDRILGALEIAVEPSTDPGCSLLKVPTYRVDVQRPCDVAEDVLRIYGYNNIEIGSTLHGSLSYKSQADTVNDLTSTIADQLTGMGFNEILNNSLTAEAYYADNAVYPLADCVRLLNPLSNELCVMRQTLLYGGLESLAHNLNRREEDLLMYEFGHVYRRNPKAESTAEAPLAPFSEGSRLAVWMTGNIVPASWLTQARPVTFYDLRAVVDNILSRLGISPREIVMEAVDAPATDDIYAAYISVKSRSGKELGSLGLLSRRVLRAFDIRQDVMFAELDFEALVKMAVRRNAKFEPLPKTHPVKRDLALLIDTSVTMEQVSAAVREAEKRMLTAVELFDVYDDPAHLPEGKKSYAISLTLQDRENTLTDKQIDQIMQRITANLAKRTGATLR